VSRESPTLAEPLSTVDKRVARTCIDRFIRRFGPAAHLLAVLALYLLAATALGLAIAAGMTSLAAWQAWVAPTTGVLHWITSGFGYGMAFFVGGFALLLVVPVYNFLLPTRIAAYHGGYFTFASVPWCLHNGLFYLVRYTFLPFVTLTPFGPWFLRAMGMRIGRRAFINTELISDPGLIRIGDDVVIGGGVHLFANYGDGGHLTIAPVSIGDRATIGLGATVMGDVIVRAGAMLLPHSVLMPGSRVGAGETWGGVPARPLSERVQARLRRLRSGPLASQPPSRQSNTPTQAGVPLPSTAGSTIQSFQVLSASRDQLRGLPSQVATAAAGPRDVVPARTSSANDVNVGLEFQSHKHA
jgi:acetyltransferase-like isoleucine patch superfamily enzyme